MVKKQNKKCNWSKILVISCIVLLIIGAGWSFLSMKNGENFNSYSNIQKNDSYTMSQESRRELDNLAKALDAFGTDSSLGDNFGWFAWYDYPDKNNVRLYFIPDLTVNLKDTTPEEYDAYTTNIDKIFKDNGFTITKGSYKEDPSFASAFVTLETHLVNCHYTAVWYETGVGPTVICYAKSTPSQVYDKVSEAWKKIPADVAAKYSTPPNKKYYNSRYTVSADGTVEGVAISNFDVLVKINGGDWLYLTGVLPSTYNSNFGEQLYCKDLRNPKYKGVFNFTATQTCL